jgi:Surfeit locus protein 6
MAMTDAVAETPALSLDAVRALSEPIAAVLDSIPRDVYNPGGNARGKLVAADAGKGTKGKGKGKSKGKADGKGAENPQLKRKLETKGGGTAGPPGVLKTKLQARVKELREARKADEPAVKEKAEQRKRKRDDLAALGESERKKLKREKSKDKEKAKGKRKGKDATNDDGGNGKKAAAAEGGSGEDGEEDRFSTLESESDGNDADRIEISGVEAGDKHGKQAKERRRGRKQTKLEVLERELETVKEADAKSAAGEEDAGVLAREMEKALVRAGGGTVKDKAAKIKKTIRKEKSKKEKSKVKWEERKAGVEEDKIKRQEVREERLKERREGKGKGSKGGKKGGKGGKKGKGKSR